MQQLFPEQFTKMTKFRLLTHLIRQLGYHFARVNDGLAGSPMFQEFTTFGAKFFGGILKHQVITEDSHLLDFLLDTDNWYEPFGDQLVNKFPYLIT